jgi:hypothetical protein
MSALAETDAASFQNFADSTRTYRSKVHEYISSRTDGFSAPCLFTQLTEEEMIECGRLRARERPALEEWKRNRSAKQKPQVWELWMRNKVAKQQPLDLQDLPSFACKANLLKSLQRAIPDMGLLVFISIVFFALSFVAFVRYDARSD